ncbi:MAG TPA: endonuclease III [Thermoanaerobaculia bacterium]|nr:endonuclease III [Thermoanaerobaculia bacterium]
MAKANAKRVSEDTAQKDLAGLHELYPDADVELRWETPLELLVATILSAQSTDERVNKVTEDVFAKFRTARDYTDADPAAFQEEIRSTGFFRQKGKNVQGAARKIVEDFGGEVPETMEELVTLPGVARKTANLVLGTAFGKAEGVVVDTHVKRVSYRLGLTLETAPEKVERDLMDLLPRDEWIFAGHALILHGRRVCVARKPRCSACGLAESCPRNGVEASA